MNASPGQMARAAEGLWKPLGPWQTLRWWQDHYLPQIWESICAGESGVMIACTGSGKSIAQAEIVARALQTLKDGWVIIVSVPTQALVEQLAGVVRGRPGAILAACGKKNVGRWYGKKKELRRVIVVCHDSMNTLADRLAVEGARVALHLKDECHLLYPEKMREQAIRLAPTRSSNFTATPFRSARTQGLWGVDRVIGRYLMGDAMRDGALVPFSVVRSEEEAPLDERCLRMILEHRRGPTVTSASSIVDAERFATKLREAGLRSAVVHSQLSSATNDRVLNALVARDLDVVVHVALLVEGVDIPELEVGQFRRKTESRVRLVQELGRYLRTSPGKERAIILDPNDLLRSVGISTEARLEGPAGDVQAMDAADRVCEADAEGEEPQKPSQQQLLQALDATSAPDTRMTIAVTAAESWVADMVLIGQMHGIVESAVRHGTDWREDPPTGKQISVLSSFVNRSSGPIASLPSQQRDAIRVLVRNPRSLSRGAASDVISLMHGIKTQQESAGSDWRWPGVVALPELDDAFLNVLDGAR